MFQVLDSGSIKNLPHANTCVLLSTFASPSCVPQKCLPRLGNLVVTYRLLQLFDGAWGKEKPEQMLGSFDAYTVYCPVIGNNKTILIQIPINTFIHFSNSI